MSARTTSFLMLGNLALVIIGFSGEILSESARAAPAPKSKIYGLLYVPKKSNRFETIQNRRSQITSIKSRSTLYAAIRSLKGVDLPLLPNKGKGRGVEDDHEDDVAWLAEHLQIESLDGTGVLRIALDTGNSLEQALLVNAVVHAYFRLEVDSQKKNCETRLKLLKEMVKTLQAELRAMDGRDKKLIEHNIVEAKATIRRNEEELRTLPRLLELAEVPPK
jgi:hypothetical protein